MLTLYLKSFQWSLQRNLSISCWIFIIIMVTLHIYDNRNWRKFRKKFKNSAKSCPKSDLYGSIINFHLFFLKYKHKMINLDKYRVLICIKLVNFIVLYTSIVLFMWKCLNKYILNKWKFYHFWNALYYFKQLKCNSRTL